MKFTSESTDFIETFTIISLTKKKSICVERNPPIHE